MKTHQWNTGRHYDQHGQRMVARYDSNNKRILFSDLSRHINGYIPTAMWVNTDNHALEVLVMTNYDFGNYSGSNVTLTWKETTV